MQIYSVYDNKAGTWMQPYYANNKPVALRTFSDAANDPTSMLNKHPTDFVLYHVGEWDDQKGKITAQEPAENHGMANEYIQQTTDLRAVQ